MSHFHEDIMELCAKGERCMDAILDWAEQNDQDPEIIGELISNDPLLKGRIEIEAEALHFIKARPRLHLEFEEE